MQERAYVWKRADRAVVRVFGLMGGSGTGFHIKAKSGKTYIVTNKHVCAEAILGLLSVEGETRTVVTTSDKYDLCLIEPLKGRQPLKLASRSARRLSNIYTAGFPGGMPKEIRAGYLHGTYTNTGGPDIDNYSFMVVPGCSGSPVMNSRAEVVGVVAWRNTRTGNGMGVRHNQLKEFLANW